MKGRAPALWAVLPLACPAATGLPQDALQPAGPAAADIARFGTTVLLVFCVVIALMWLLLAGAAWLQRGSFEEHAALGSHDGRLWIVLGGGVIPAVVLIVLFATMFAPMGAASHGMAAQRTPAEIRIVGHQWWFEAQYLGDTPAAKVEVPTEIHIPVGRPVDIELQSADVVHSFWVPKLAGKTDLIPGVSNRLRLEASQPGVYHGECAEFCGVQHAHMRLLVVAEPPADYAAWLARQRAPAWPAAHDAQAARGAALFQRGACPLCHTVRGTPARGSVGPDLTHVASRRRIAGGMLDNDTANLTAWVVDAQSLKPGAHMPSLHNFDGAELRAVVVYLQSLK